VATPLRHLNTARAAVAGWLQGLYINHPDAIRFSGWRFRAYQLGTRLYH
jgi:hypothetical protein